MSISALTLLVAEEAHSESVNHWLIGAITLAILIGMLFALVSFGSGREHS